jgi:hypothetical protein
MTTAVSHPNKVATGPQAIAFVRKNGIVLEAGRGSLLSLAEAVAQGPIKGSWWSHPQGKEIFALTRAVRDSNDILVCRVAKGKVTFVHRKLWPALVRLAHRFPHKHLGQIKEEHTSSGRHVVRTTPFPDWVSPEISVLAKRLSEAQAVAQLGCLPA